ncbi:hypothetical protein QYF36_001120 [Acer negundo]|nr:hypothetical protein QYF36_001120 [Acer negundo]
MADLENNEKPLRKIADAFKELEATVNSQTPGADVEVAPFSRACSLVSPLIGCLGIAFKFAEMDYVAKVHDLAEASKSIGTLQIMLDRDIKENRVRKVGSHTRNLLRVKRGLDLVKVLFEQILAAEIKNVLLVYNGLLVFKELEVRYKSSIFIVLRGNSVKDPVFKAYAKVFAPHHGWAIRKAVEAGMYALPTRAQMLSKLNEDETSARIQMQSYITTSASVILYIEKLYHSRELGIDW